MNKLFTKYFINNLTHFSIAYFSLLALDIWVKLQIETIPYRYVSKSLLIILLIVFYLKNHNESMRKNFWLMIAALCSFMIGDWLLIEPTNSFVFAVGMIFFVIGKTCYAFRFSNQRDFNLGRLLPFLIICFLYILGLMNLIYDNLNELFFPVLIYFFASIIVLQLAFLRQGDVNKLSYWLVFSGMIASMGSDSITALKTFYLPDFAYEKVTIMLFYGISQYLIVLGIVKEVKLEEEEISTNTVNS
ncbi:MAG: lysoplasmalogenase [Flavobacteriaceae bacterium]|nr:lysoplasmalogenase [Flavobacteriaceae bacterium]